MLRIDRPTADVRPQDIATVLLALLGRVVVRLAERLQLTVPEIVVVASMGLYVVGYLGKRGVARCLAYPA